MKNSLLKPEPGKTLYKQLFYFLTAVFALSFFVVLLASGGYSMRGLLDPDRSGTFMEFFNNLILSDKEPYKSGSLTPPFAILLYRGLLTFVSPATLKTIVKSPSSSSFSPLVKTYQQFYFPFIVFALLSLCLLFFALRALKSGCVGEKIGFIFAVFLSAPMLFALERGSDVVLTLGLVALFFAGKDSEKKLTRNLSLAALGVACAFGFYPLLFCIALAGKKRFIDILKVFGVFITLTVPALFIVGGGIGGAGLYVRNLVNVWKDNSLNVLGQLNFSGDLVYLLSGTGASNGALTLAGTLFAAAAGLLTLAGAILAKKDWQSTALICCLICGISPLCDTSLLVFFAIPISMILDGETENSAVTYISLTLTVLTQALIVSPDISVRSYTRAFITRISGFSVLALALLLFAVSISDLIKRHVEKVPETAPAVKAD